MRMKSKRTCHVVKLLNSPGQGLQSQMRHDCLASTATRKYCLVYAKDSVRYHAEHRFCHREQI